MLFRKDVSISEGMPRVNEALDPTRRCAVRLRKDGALSSVRSERSSGCESFSGRDRWMLSVSLLRRGTTTLLLAAAVILTSAAADPTVAQSSRFDKLGHRIMCSCSCNEILLECNHVGCPNSSGMRQELMAGVDRGDSDKTIFAAFVAKYGPTSLAAPSGEGFNIIGWVMPFAVLILGIGGTSLLIRKWRLRTVATPPPSSTPRFSDIRARIRRETEL